MGVHFVNGGLVGDHLLDAAQPEILVYEPLKNGRLWAWKDNPHGAYVDWNPRVSCADYAPDS
jgi:hypothetical protein